MNRFLIILFTLSLALSYTSFSANTGSIEGKVTDDNGQPVIAGSVRVLGTTQGAKTKVDGSYAIIGVAAGNYDVEYSYVGLRKDTVKVKVSSGKVTRVDRKLSASEVVTETVVVYGTRLVDKNTKESVTTVSQEEIKNRPTNSVNAIVAMTKGVQQSGSGFQVRNSRVDQTVIKLDGVQISDVGTGGYGIGNGAMPTVSQHALAEVNVKTGGFSAADGAATGGVVDMTVAPGKNNSYDGFFNYRTDVGALWGRQASNIRLDYDNLSIENYGEGHKLLGPQENQFEFGISGPIPLTEKSTFNINTNNRFRKYAGSGWEITDPLGNNITQFDNNSAMIRNITGKLSFVISDDIQLITGGTWGMTNIQSQGGWGWLYATRPAAQQFFSVDPNTGLKDANTQFNNMPENVYKNGGTHFATVNGYAQLKHQLTSESRYEFAVRYNRQESMTGRLQDYGDPNYFTGWDFIEPEDDFSTAGGQYYTSQNEQYLIGNQAHDLYEVNIFDEGRTDDLAFAYATKQIENVFTGYLEGAADARGTNNPYGVDRRFVNAGSGGYQYRTSEFFQVDGLYEVRFDSKDFKHYLKTGFEFRQNTIERHNAGDPWNGSLIGKDLYSDSWDNIYANAEETTYLNLANQAKDPFNFNVFVQDQIDYEGFVFTPGFRIDGFQANSKHRNVGVTEGFITLDKYDQINPNSGEPYFLETDFRLFFSPRMNITYPIGEDNSTILRLNYGIFYKIAPLQPMFDNFNMNSVIGNSGLRIGDPNLDPERTNMYEIALDHQVADDFVLSVNAYYKDVYNELGVVAVRTLPTPYFQTAVTEYGTYRGLEFEFFKRASDNYGFRLNYTLQQALGTADGINTNLNNAVDRSIPGIEIFPFPLNPFPLSRDVRHRINLFFNVYLADGEGPSIAGYKPFESTDLSIDFSWRSGLPYTVTDLNGTFLSERNSERFPSVWNSNIKLRRTLQMEDFFGPSWKKISVDFYVDVFNWLNNTQVTSWFTNSADPDLNLSLQTFTKGNLQNIDYYQEYEPTNPVSISIQQYDNFGARIYNQNADIINADGIVSQDEMYNANLRYLETTLKFKPNYLGPRTIWFGAKVNF